MSQTDSTDRSGEPLPIVERTMRRYLIRATYRTAGCFTLITIIATTHLLHAR